MYRKVSTSLNFIDREKEIIDFWKKNKIFEKSVIKNEGNTEFSFYDGPPTANGKPHIGHILTRVIKDIIPRYKTMKGYHVQRKAGWDTHGLPVELEVERTLGMDGKQDIEKYGIEPFIKKCKESVWKYKGEWEKMSDRVGYWVDMDNPYITYDDNYIESVWWSLKEIDSKGLLYKGHKIVPYCPRCGTALSSHEVAQGYKDVEEISIFVKFKIKELDNAYFLAWTTTPWTLPSNVALCMNPNEEYSLITANGERYVMAKALIQSLFDEYEIIETKTGKEYEGMKYEPLFDYVKDSSDAFYITLDTYVTLTDGTGIVHIAPAFGEDDAKVGMKYKLPFVQLVDDRGKFVKEAYDLFETFAKDADKVIIEKLREKGLLLKEFAFTHSYPYCWRCDTPLLYYARSSWFIKMTAVRDKLLENNSKINWYPPTIGTGRMGNFLENVVDWGISRERYWGTPLPIWVCDKCGKKHTIGSKAELREMSGITEDVELHKPFIDKVKIKCECGGVMTRTPEVLDCWYDSGAMPFAQLHYPFENKDLFNLTYPADFISEAIDQTRGWFYTLLAISTLIFDRASFINCIVLGHVNDKNGFKMSKHKGNVVEPQTILDKQGADAVRWYFYTGSAPWLPSRFYEEAVSEAQRKFMGTLWNTYAFFVLYAEIDKYNPTKYNLEDCKLTQMDKWVLSGLNTLVKYVDECLDGYKITESARAIQDFVDKLSNWYVRRCRERYWGADMTDDKIAAYTTLYTVLTTLAKVNAPFVPFMAEQIYLNLVANFDKNAPESVHLSDFPKYDESYIDSALEKDMDFVLDIVTLGRAARNKVNIKNRQPLSKLFVLSEQKLSDGKMSALIKGELNVKEVIFTDDESRFISYRVKPQLKTLGPKYGKLLPKISAYLESADAGEIVKAVEDGVYEFETDGVDVTLNKEDLQIFTDSVTGYVSESDRGITAVLDTNLTEELIGEGIAREIISKIQTMRKEAGFEVTDHIALGFNATGRVKEVISSDKEILKDVLADSADQNLDGYIREWEIGGEQIKLSVKKI
ncbi:MAG: isoleucine--tRNA ligase [Christensenellales bacterium]|jgi:isoleucyl-tRNA synthetase